MTSADLNPELRRLIDARLEAIDRVLAMAQVGWTERRSIVGEVETQIFELLARRSEAPTYDDVVTVISSLDPPESYTSAEAMGTTAEPRFADADRARPWRHLPGQAARQLIGIVPTVGGAVALLVINGLVIALIAETNGVIPWLVTLACIAWLNVQGIRWFRNWSQTRQGNLLDDLRYSLGSWLMPKQPVQPI
jgi:hypothetical protein